jgi:hypothetical protein
VVTAGTTAGVETAGVVAATLAAAAKRAAAAGVADAIARATINAVSGVVAAAAVVGVVVVIGVVAATADSDTTDDDGVVGIGVNNVEPIISAPSKSTSYASANALEKCGSDPTTGGATRRRRRRRLFRRARSGTATAAAAADGVVGADAGVVAGIGDCHVLPPLSPPNWNGVGVGIAGVNFVFVTWSSGGGNDVVVVVCSGDRTSGGRGPFVGLRGVTILIGAIVGVVGVVGVEIEEIGDNVDDVDVGICGGNGDNINGGANVGVVIGDITGDDGVIGIVAVVDSGVSVGSGPIVGIVCVAVAVSRKGKTFEVNAIGSVAAVAATAFVVDVVVAVVFVVGEVAGDGDGVRGDSVDVDVGKCKYMPLPKET